MPALKHIIGLMGAPADAGGTTLDERQVTAAHTVALPAQLFGHRVQP